MVSADAIRTGVGILGELGWCSSTTFVRIWKKGSVEQFSPIPYVATLLNCMMWVVYGLPMVHPHSMLVITINGSGLAIELSYVLLFLVYSHGSKRLKVLLMLLAETAFVAAVALLVLTLAHTHERRSMIVGVLCVFFGTMMYAAPLSVMIPNGLGVVFAVAQLMLYATYYQSTQTQTQTQTQIEAVKRKTEMGLTDVVVVKGAPNKAGNVPFAGSNPEIRAM
ncbi:hypothetical protein BHM03_00011299 [Ensete ventricosum]|nr:hypothetical protein BHM03_00011299 [Ensete ventricosum]